MEDIDKLLDEADEFFNKDEVRSKPFSKNFKKLDDDVSR